ncbi:Class III cytochrome C family protein [Humidesulfovibrio mexicanus]|uniref:Class III cytochrome C family protein n=1 Tax=Humidesulfovibrio mexicanus TaxID=147047 RepID=A0A239C3A0_9BACT|nr:cytochrome c3 family protein [Humidesulfovibrio mexicanus]SNS14765.1 Class III cytochrome C family protein [Humidesulfovibrio mexicanus]
MDRRVLLLSAGTLFSLALVSVLSLEAQGVGEARANAAARADVVTIDAMKELGALELPPVTFLHDKHVEAVKGSGAECSACHLQKDGKLLVRFKREQNASFAETKSVYHQNCIGCHTDLAAKGRKTGPQDGDCRSCHDARPRVVSVRQPAGFDNALHFRHSESREIPSGVTGASGEAVKDNCNRCHHEYNTDAKKTFYAKGKEQSCRACHQEKATKEVRSMARASHESCVSCHLSLAKAGKKQTGPVDCVGCHGKEAQAQTAARSMAAAAKAPEGASLIRRGQPELTLMSINKPDPGVKPLAMSPAVFNHKTHEKNVAACRSCHHKEMKACNACHTVQGSKDGGFVPLEQAMHRATAKQSCVGCHNTKKADPKCAGCHDLMKARKNPPADSCTKCHIGGKLAVPAEPGAMPAYWSMKPEEKAAAAKTLLQGRPVKADIYALEDIPEKVVINALADEYEASVMPHRKIVLKMAEGIKDSTMAGVFHADPGTLCQACHHKGQAGGTKKPPTCASCHARPFDAKNPGRPGLKAAYHGQCMGCHQSMALKKPLNTDCAGCHTERRK